MKYTATVKVDGESLKHFWIQEKLGNSLRLGEEFILPNDNVLYEVKRKIITYYMGDNCSVEYLVKKI